MNNLNKLIDIIKDKFSEEHINVILMYLEHCCNYRLVDLDYPKGYIVNSETHYNKSNEIFNLILNILNELSFPIKIKYGVQIENFLFLNWNESNSILYHELQESINDVTHLGFREYISDIIDNAYIDDDEHIIESLNLKYFSELKDFKPIITVHSDISQTDYLILTKQ